MKQIIVFIALIVLLFFPLSNLHAMECQILNEEGYAFNSAKAGDTVYFKSTYAYKKSKKLSWSLAVSLPSIDMRNNKTSAKYNGYFSHEGSLANKSRLIPVLIPEDQFINGVATFKYSLTGNGKCSVNLNIVQDPAPDTTGRLKIFVTSQAHIGDFANDPYLTGATGIARADDFCNKDSNKPSDAYYKALLVDGINRDAVKMIDWVLHPNTTYYRSDNITEIGTTTANAIFPSAYADLTNSIQDRTNYDENSHDLYLVWTGLANSTDFTAGSSSQWSFKCNNWSYEGNLYCGTLGCSYQKDALAFSSGGCYGCSMKVRLYCVEQP
jgi:hypothetical protein